MANVLIARGGSPDFKAMMCEGAWAEYGPPFDAPHMPATPPFDSHADGAHMQGYLNLHFPLVPNLADTRAHHWMQTAMKDLNTQGDILFTNWVPQRSFISALYLEVSATDSMLDGVYFKPVAYRAKPVIGGARGEVTYEEITAFSDEVAAAGLEKMPLGTPAADDKLYSIIMLNRDTANVVPSTFGHNIVKRDAQGNVVEGYDEYFGGVVLGLQFHEGDDVKIANIWKSRIAVYLSAKLFTFEGSSQVG